MIHVDDKISSQKLEKAILIGVWGRNISREKAEEYLDELGLLADTAGALVVRTFMQRVERIVPSTYVGTGKLEEIRAYCEEHKVNLVIFDDDLSPSQVRNIDKAIGVKVLDRTGIILHIFSDRARTAQAMAQVELAQLQYILPRLAGLWTHLEKQRGGIGLKGAGEKEIETDRRIIRRKISLLEEKLKKISLQNQTQRKTRNQLARISLVGYTNAGKSTLMNRLSKSTVLAEDKLFATLDTTVRKLVWNGLPFLLSDTVGFIRKLPHDLVECFRSTLDEVRESDVLLHVVDISNPSFEEQMAVVIQTLGELGVGDKPVIVVFNKMDRLTPDQQVELKESWLARHNAPAVFISAEKKEGIEELRSAILGHIKALYKERFPYAQQTENFWELPADLASSDE
jgi:GTP-binding protein HflX